MQDPGAKTRDREAKQETVRAGQISFVRRVLVAVGITALAAVLLFVVWTTAQILLLVFAGILLAVFLRGLSSLVRHHTPLSRGWSLAVVVLALVAITGIGASLLAPPLAQQFDQLMERLPQAMEQLRQQFGQFELGRRLLAQGQRAGLPISSPAGIVSRIVGTAGTVFDVLAGFLIVLAVGLYLAASPEPYVKGLVRLLPPQHRDRAREVLSALGRTLWYWLLGQIAAMIVVGTLTSLGLMLIGVPLGLIFGLLTGLLEFIPYLGPALGITPAILLALLQSPTQALAVVGIYTAVQLAESYLILPVAQLIAVDLPPALTITSQILMGVLFGPLGILLATPLVAVTIVLVKMLYVEDVLGEPVKLPGEKREGA